jgi:hypothetical protein
MFYVSGCLSSPLASLTAYPDRTSASKSTPNYSKLPLRDPAPSDSSGLLPAPSARSGRTPAGAGRTPHRRRIGSRGSPPSARTAPFGEVVGVLENGQPRHQPRRSVPLTEQPGSRRWPTMSASYQNRVRAAPLGREDAFSLMENGNLSIGTRSEFRRC